MIQIGTCGTKNKREDSFWDSFDFLIGGYLFDRAEAIALGKRLNKPVWQTFWYGHRHSTLPTNWKKPPSSHEDWLERALDLWGQGSDRIILANEFLAYQAPGYYPNFSPDDLVRYIQIIRNVAPNLSILLCEFRCQHLFKWKRLAELCGYLKDKGTPIDAIGIQLHLKQGPKAWLILNLYLPQVVKLFTNQGIEVSFNEVSVWTLKGKPDRRRQIWEQVFAIAERGDSRIGSRGDSRIAEELNISSVVPWWIDPDYDLDCPMPTFQDYENGHYSDFLAN